MLEHGTLEGKPVLVAATAGTARHSLVLDHAMRPLFAYLRAVVVPTGVFAASEDFGRPTVAGALSTRIDRAAGELAALVGCPHGAPSVATKDAGPSTRGARRLRAVRGAAAPGLGRPGTGSLPRSVLVGAVEDRAARPS